VRLVVTVFLNPMSDNRIQVSLVSHNRLVREALGSVLSREPGIRIIASVSFDSTALDRINANDVDVLVLHLAGTPLGGLEIVASLLGRKTNLRVVTIASDANDGVRFLGLGPDAASYVLQDPSLTEVILAVRAAGSRGEHSTCGVPKTFFESSFPGASTRDLERLTAAIGGPVSEPRLLVNCCDDWLRLFGKFVSENYITAEEQP
jgi:DNA-binding NarL/FixJ family response regulator